MVYICLNLKNVLNSYKVVTVLKYINVIINNVR